MNILKSGTTSLAAPAIVVVSLAVAVFNGDIQAASRIVYVSEYGATVDDGTDDTAAIDEAIAHAISLPGSKMLIFDEGTYNVTDSLDIDKAKNLTVVGAVNKTDGWPGTRLLMNNSWDWHGEKFFVTTNSENVTVRNFITEFDVTPGVLGRVVAIDGDEVTIEVVLPQDTTDMPETHICEKGGTYIYDMDLLQKLNKLAGRDVVWNKVPGSTTQLTTNYPGIAEQVDIGVSIHSIAFYTEYWAAPTRVHDSKNYHAENIVNRGQGSNFLGTTTENVTIRRHYYDNDNGIYDAGRSNGTMIRDCSGLVLVDTMVSDHHTGEEDTNDFNTYLSEVKSVDNAERTEFTLGGRRGKEYNHEGDRIAFYKDFSDPYPDFTTRYVTVDNLKITVADPLPSWVGQYTKFYCLDHQSAATRLIDSRFLGTKFFIRGWDVLYDDCEFASSIMVQVNTILAADSIAEGPPPANARVTNTVFRNHARFETNTPKKDHPIRYVKDEDQLFEDITIANSVFLDKSHIDLDQINGLMIKDNLFSDALDITVGPHVSGLVQSGNKVLKEDEVNLLADGGFESGEFGNAWSLDAGDAEIVGSDARNGDYCLKIPGGYTQVTQTLTGLEENTWYILRYHARRSARTNITELVTKVYDTGTGYDVFSQERMRGTSYSSMEELCFKTENGVTSARISFASYDMEADEVMIDDVSVSKIIDLPVKVFTNYQAEEATLVGCNALSDDYAFNGKYVSGIDADGDHVEWNNVAGSKHLTIRYSTTNALGKLALYVNGEFRRLVEFPETAFDSGKWAWNEVKLYNVNLPDDSSIEMRFESDKGCQAANIDSIMVRSNTLEDVSGTRVKPGSE